LIKAKSRRGYKISTRIWWN